MSTTPERLHTGEAASADCSGVEDVWEEGGEEVALDHHTVLEELTW